MEPEMNKEKEEILRILEDIQKNHKFQPQLQGQAREDNLLAIDKRIAELEEKKRELGFLNDGSYTTKALEDSNNLLKREKAAKAKLLENKTKLEKDVEKISADMLALETEIRRLAAESQNYFTDAGQELIYKEKLKELEKEYSQKSKEFKEKTGQPGTISKKQLKNIKKQLNEAKSFTGKQRFINEIVDKKQREYNKIVEEIQNNYNYQGRLLEEKEKHLGDFAGNLTKLETLISKREKSIEQEKELLSSVPELKTENIVEIDKELESLNKARTACNLGNADVFLNEVIDDLKSGDTNKEEILEDLNTLKSAVTPAQATSSADALWKEFEEVNARLKKDEYPLDEESNIRLVRSVGQANSMSEKNSLINNTIRHNRTAIARETKKTEKLMADFEDVEKEIAELEKQIESVKSQHIDYRLAGFTVLLKDSGKAVNLKRVIDDENLETYAKINKLLLKKDEIELSLDTTADYVLSLEEENRNLATQREENKAEKRRLNAIISNYRTNSEDFTDGLNNGYDSIKRTQDEERKTFIVAELAKAETYKNNLDNSISEKLDNAINLAQSLPEIKNEKTEEEGLHQQETNHTEPENNMGETDLDEKEEKEEKEIIPPIVGQATGQGDKEELEKFFNEYGGYAGGEEVKDIDDPDALLLGKLDSQKKKLKDKILKILAAVALLGVILAACKGCEHDRENPEVAPQPESPIELEIEQDHSIYPILPNGIKLAERKPSENKKDDKKEEEKKVEKEPDFELPIGPNIPDFPGPGPGPGTDPDPGPGPGPGTDPEPEDSTLTWTRNDIENGIVTAKTVDLPNGAVGIYDAETGILTVTKDGVVVGQYQSGYSTNPDSYGDSSVSDEDFNNLVNQYLNGDLNQVNNDDDTERLPGQPGGTTGEEVPFDEAELTDGELENLLNALGGQDDLEQSAAVLGGR